MIKRKGRRPHRGRIRGDRGKQRRQDRGALGGAPQSSVAFQASPSRRVRARKLRGWVAERGLFGVQTRALCNAARPAGPGRG